MEETEYARWQKMQQARARVNEQIRRSSQAEQNRARMNTARRPQEQQRQTGSGSTESFRRHRGGTQPNYARAYASGEPQRTRQQGTSFQERPYIRNAPPKRTASASSAGGRSRSSAGDPSGRGQTARKDSAASYASAHRDYENRRLQEERMKREAANERARKEAYRKETIEVYKARIALCIIFFVILAALTALFFFIGFNRTKKGSLPSTVKYTYGETTVSLPQTEAFSDTGTLYLDFNAVAELLSMAVVGDVGETKFLFVSDATASSAGSAGDEYAIFRADSRNAVINGQPVTMTDNATVSEDGHWMVPADFVTTYMQNLALNVKGKKVTVTRIVSNPDRDKGEPVEYYPVSFTLKPIVTLPTIPEDDYTKLGGSETYQTPEGTYDLDFKADLSAYEQYMDPADRDGYLVLINNDHTVDAKFIPNDLVDVVNTRKDGRATQKMQRTAAKALEAMYLEMAANGITDVSVTSAYRTYEYQSSLFNTYTAQEMKANPKLTLEQAQTITATYSARPGTSEHQSGLCCDMHNLSSADVAFAKKDAYKWLSENAWKFGFILRFPEDKVDVTQISFEPWHYRFVGRYHAKAIHDAGLCLEEYLITIKK